jgi:hypothetical protein
MFKLRQTPTPRDLVDLDASRRWFIYSEANRSFPTLLMNDGDTFHFDTPSGHAFAGELSKTRTQKPVHDYIIEGVCKALDGVHVLFVVKTGGGNSSYRPSYTHILHALNAHLSLPKFKRRILENRSLAVVVYDTECLSNSLKKLKHKNVLTLNQKTWWLLGIRNIG